MPLDIPLFTLTQVSFLLLQASQISRQLARLSAWIVQAGQDVIVARDLLEGCLWRLSGNFCSVLVLHVSQLKASARASVPSSARSAVSSALRRRPRVPGSAVGAPVTVVVGHDNAEVETFASPHVQCCCNLVRHHALFGFCRSKDKLSGTSRGGHTANAP